MDFILKQLMDQFSGGTTEQIGKQVGAQENQVQNVLQGALPILMSALTKNASDKQGANSLLSALDTDHDGSILDNVMDLIQKPEAGAGNGILKHVLGNQRQGVEQYLGAKNGMDAQSIGKILQIAAPILMGILGKQKKQQQNTNPSSFLDLLKGTQQQSVRNSTLESTIIEQLIGGGGKSKSGSIIPMVFDLFKRFTRK